MSLDVAGPGHAVRTLIVDDSRTIRSLIRHLLTKDPRVTVVGEASDPYEAREKIKELSPDVLTLDVEMPRMNGLVFLEKLMRLRPMPVIMVSTRTAEQSDAAIRALSLGAVDCIDLKKLQANDPKVPDLADTLVMAARARLSPRRVSQSATSPVGDLKYSWNGRFVVIGSSTGGVDALSTILEGYPANCPPTVIAQHMPEAFLESFARRLDARSAPTIRLARDRDLLEQGTVLIASGGRFHVTVTRPRQPKITLVEDDGAALYVPSVDTLFSSVAPFGPRMVGVILTGMGRDGAQSLSDMKANGAHTIVQSGETAVVDGMPRAARDIGAAVEVVDIADMASTILKRTSK